MEYPVTPRCNIIPKSMFLPTKCTHISIPQRCGSYRWPSVIVECKWPPYIGFVLPCYSFQYQYKCEFHLHCSFVFQANADWNGTVEMCRYSMTHMSSHYHSIAIKISSLVVTKMADHSPMVLKLTKYVSTYANIIY